MRLRLTLKISQDETTRLLAAVLQQQLRAAGIELKIRSAEFGTFYADVTHGAFQMYILKWIGSNEDPDIYRYMDSSGSFPPKGANRGHYVNARVDALLAKAAAESGPAAEVEARRRAEYVEAQQILAEELPAIPLWFPGQCGGAYAAVAGGGVAGGRELRFSAGCVAAVVSSTENTDGTQSLRIGRAKSKCRSLLGERVWRLWRYELRRGPSTQVLTIKP